MAVNEKKIKIHHLIKSRVKHHVSRLTKVWHSNKMNESVPDDFPLIEEKALYRIVAALSYVHILILIPIIFGRKSSFVKYHVRQGLSLLVLWVLVLFLFWIPALAWIILILTVLGLFEGIFNVAKGKEKPLPYLGKLFFHSSIQ